MPKPTVQSFAALPLGPSNNRKKRLKAVWFGGGTAPPTDSPVKVWTGTEWVSTGINVVLPP